MDVMKTIVPRSAGPWGGCSGKGWDDGVFCTIKQVQVHEALHSSVISAIQIEYENKLDKSSFWSQLHGHEHGAKKTTKVYIYIYLSFTSHKFLFNSFVFIRF